MIKRVSLLRFAALLVMLSFSFAGQSRAEASPQKLITDEGTNTEYLLLERSYYPVSGEAYGVLWSEQNRMNVKVFWGDSEAVLDHGAGTCMSGVLPGTPGPVILAGHVLSYFNSLQYLHTGDSLHLDTWYGTYDYEITEIEVYDQFELQDLIDHKVGHETETVRVFLLDDGSEKETVYEPEDQVLSERNIIWMNEEEAVRAGWQKPEDQELPEELILYTCYPFYSTGREKTDRYTVIARKTSGPSVIWTPDKPQIIFSDEGS